MAQQVRLIQGNPQEGTNMAQQVRLIKERRKDNEFR